MQDNMTGLDATCEINSALTIPIDLQIKPSTPVLCKKTNKELRIQGFVKCCSTDPSKQKREDLNDGS